MSKENAENKTAVLHMRINPETKRKAEEIFSACGLTMTDAVTIFLQQAINVRGMPLLIMEDSKEALRQQSIAMLMTRLYRSEASVDDYDCWLTEQEVMKEFGAWLPWREK